MAGKKIADHLTGQEHSRQALEHFHDVHQHTQAATTGHGISAFGHDDIATLAYELWEARGCPIGSPQEDWFHAAEELRSRTGKAFERREKNTDENEHEGSDQRHASA
jgi:Protein of unknown function (DUF2934)